MLREYQILVIAFTVLTVVLSADYTNLELQKCFSTNDTIFEVKNCSITPKTFTVQIDLKQPLNKFYVSLRTCDKNGF